MHCGLSGTEGTKCPSTRGAQGDRAGWMLGCLTCGSAVWRPHSSKQTHPQSLGGASSIRPWAFQALPSCPQAVSAPSSVTLRGCSNYSCSCCLYKPIKHLLMMILLLDQWGKLTYRKPGFLTSQPGFVSPQEMASCICAALFQKRVCLLQTVLKSTWMYRHTSCHKAKHQNV